MSQFDIRFENINKEINNYSGTFLIRSERAGLVKRFRFLVENFGSPNSEVSIWKNDGIFLKKDWRWPAEEDIFNFPQIIILCMFMIGFFGEMGKPVPQPFITPPITHKTMKALLKVLSSAPDAS